MNKKYKQRFFILLQRILKSYLERDEQKRRKKTFFPVFVRVKIFYFTDGDLFAWSTLKLKNMLSEFFQEPILSVFCFLFSLSDCNIVKREEKVLNEMWIMFLYRAGFGKIVETHEILILSLFLVCFQLAIWLSEERLMFGQGLRPLGNDFSSFYQIKILLYTYNEFVEFGKTSRKILFSLNFLGAFWLKKRWNLKSFFVARYQKKLFWQLFLEIISAKFP